METTPSTTDRLPAGDYRYLPINELKKQHLDRITNGFVSLVLQVYTVVGQRITADDVSTLARALADDCCRRFGSLSMADISRALNDGARGVYGDFISPSLKLFNQWITFYRQTSSPVVLKSQPDPIPANALTPMSIDQMRQSMLLIMSQWYDKHQSLSEFYAQPMFEVIYLWLEQKGEIKISVDDKWTLYKQVKQTIFNRRTTRYQSKAQLIEAQRLHQIIVDQLKPSPSDEISIDKAVKRECYRLKLEEYISNKNKII